MVAILRWLSILTGVGWMAAVCLATAKSADPVWALGAFRRVVPSEGGLLLSLYLAWSVLLPLVGLWCLVTTFARFLRYRVILGAAVGVCAGIYLDYLQFAIPFAGDIANVPGLPAALVLYGNERLAGIWAFSFCVNIAVYGTLGSGLGFALGRCGTTVSAIVPADVSLAQRQRNPSACHRVGSALVVSVLLFIVSLWQFGPGTDGLYAFLAQFEVAPRVRFVRDVTYDRPDDVELKLDLCQPERSDGRRPAVICIHGGGWRGGTRSEYVPLIVHLARRGYVAVTIDYRLAPAHRFPAQADDVRSAVRWLRQHADEYGVDPERIGLLGWSAGGHLACFVGVAGASTELRSGDSSDPIGVQPSANVQAVVSFSGLTDLTADYWDVIPSGRSALIGSEFNRNPAAFRSASPIAFVDGNAPPFLLLHGTADPVVPLDQSLRFQNALKTAGNTVSLRQFDSQGHRWFGTRLRRANREAVEFLDLHLKSVGSAPDPATGAAEGGSG